MRLIGFFIVFVCFFGIVFSLGDPFMYSNGEPNYNLLYTENCPREMFNKCMIESNNDIFGCMNCGKKTEQEIRLEEQLQRELEDANMVSLFECKKGYVPSLLLENKCVKDVAGIGLIKESVGNISNIMEHYPELDADSDISFFDQLDNFIENTYEFLDNFLLGFWKIIEISDSLFMNIKKFFTDMLSFYKGLI